MSRVRLLRGKKSVRAAAVSPERTSVDTFITASRRSGGEPSARVAVRMALKATEPEAGSAAEAGSKDRSKAGTASLAGMVKVAGTTVYPVAAPAKVMISSSSASVSSRRVTVRDALAERALAGMLIVTVCGAE